MEECFRLADRVRSIVKDGRGEHRVGSADCEGISQMLQATGSPRCDHGNRDPHRYGSRQCQVISLLRAIAVHAREENFSGAGAFHGACPFDHIATGCLSATMGEYFPAISLRVSYAFRIDGHHDALRSKPAGGSLHELRMFHGSRIDTDLVRSCIQEGSNIVQGSHAAPDRQRHKDLLSSPSHDVKNRLPIFMGRGDVQKAKLVRTRLILKNRLLHRISCIAKALEIHAFDYEAIIHIQARNNTDFQHHILTFAMAAIFIIARPVTASAGTAVVRVSTSASSSMSSASPSLSLFQR